MLSLAVGLAALAQSSANAPPEPPRFGLVTQVEWLARPTFDDIQRAYPKAAAQAGVEGRARLKCNISPKGRLEACEVLSETPEGQGFGEAALKLVPKWRAGAHDAAPTPAHVEPVQPYLVFAVPFRLTRDAPKAPPAASLPPVEPPPAAPPPPAPAAFAPSRYAPRPYAPPPLPGIVIRYPEWVERPSDKDMKEVYPAEARGARMEGLVILGCRVQASGALERCVPESEEPPGYGFEAAALRVTYRFRMKTHMQDGTPVAGGMIRLPIRFALPGKTR